MDISRYLPEGSTGFLSPKSGKCIVCGRKFSKGHIIRRAIALEPRGKSVCLKDSPHICDEDVILYGQSTDKWPRRRLQGLDPNSMQFGDTVVSVHEPGRR